MMMPDFNFGTVESLDSVPTKYQSIYESDGDSGFRVMESAKGIVEDYQGVSKSLVSVRADKKRASDESAQRRITTSAVKEYATSLGIELSDDIGIVDGLKGHIDELTGKVKGGETLKVDLAKIRAEGDKRVAEVTSTKDAEIAERDAALTNHLISSVATAAITKQGGSLPLLLPHVESMCQVFRDDDGKYTVRVKDGQGDHRLNSQGGWMGVEDAVGELKSNNEYAPAFKSEAKQGSGTKPGSMNRTTTTGNANENTTPASKITEGLAAREK